MFQGTIYTISKPEISFILLSDREYKTREIARRVTMQNARSEGTIYLVRDARFDRRLDARVLYKCFPVILRRPDASICHCLSPRATNAFISALPQHRARWTTRDRRRVLAAGARFYKGRYCGLPWPSFRPPLNIVYWLPPPISQTLVTRSCPSPTANKPRAVIWHWLSYPASLPAGIPLWRTVRCPRHHVQSAQIKRARSISVLASESSRVLKEERDIIWFSLPREKEY